MTPRTLQPSILADLSRKMVLLGGPRQVGKTTLARAILEASGGGAYYSWDNRRDRRVVLGAEWPAPPAVVVLDELHKYRHWKRWLKGEFDQHGAQIRFLVTGSARLDVYRMGGDSLQGRYHHYRLHPFSLGEVDGRLPRVVPLQPLEPRAPEGRDSLGALSRWSGFPEPILAGSERAHRRWQKDRLDRFFREDVRDLENVRDLSSMQLLADLLPSRVGSPLSLNALREDLEVSHRAVTNWVEILERLYYAFRLPPWSNRLARTLRKETKAYLWDWTLVEDPGARFENLVASHLLKLCHHLEDTEGHAVRLHYLRDREKREVDFLVTVGRKPWFAVEAKVGSERASPHLRYFGQRLKIPFLYQVVADGKRDFVDDGVRVVPAARFLAGLP